MIFYSDKHQHEYQEHIRNVPTQYLKDGYTPTMLYLESLLKAIVPGASMFDLKSRRIRRDCLDEAWQTSGTLKLCRLAFNLWNGYREQATIYETFGTDLDRYLLQAISLRYDICY